LVLGFLDSSSLLPRQGNDQRLRRLSRAVNPIDLLFKEPFRSSELWDYDLSSKSLNQAETFVNLKLSLTSVMVTGADASRNLEAMCSMRAKSCAMF
jgi:hypothetical protein